MSFSASWEDLDLFTAIFLLAMLAADLGLVIWGIHKHSQAFSRPPGKPRFDQLRLWNQLVKWQVVPPSYTPPAELEEFARSRDFIQSAAAIGSGLAIAIAMIGSAALSVAATGSLLSILAVAGYFFGALLLFASLMGYSLGYAYGVWQLHRLTTKKIAYGDLKPRRLADYRSVFFPWIAVILIVYTILVPLLLMSYLGSRIPLSPLSNSPLEAPTWILEAIPAAMLLALVTGEVIMARLARLPRLLLIANPQTAQRADNLLRAMSIGQLQGLTLAAIGYLGVAQGFILQQFFGQLGVTSHGWNTGALIFAPELVFPFAIGLAGNLLPMLAGRVGGSISGWPWRPVPIP